MHWLLVALLAMVIGILVGALLAAGFLLMVDGERGVAEMVHDAHDGTARGRRADPGRGKSTPRAAAR